MKTKLKGLSFKRLLIPRLQDRFNHLIIKYLREHDVTQNELCDLVSIPNSHLSNLLHNKRTLSASYILKFIIHGVIMVNEINDGMATQDMEKEFWSTAETVKRIGLLNKIATAEKLGLDIEGLLDAYIKSSKKR